MENVWKKKTSSQTRRVRALQLLVSFPTVICVLCSFTPKRFSVVRGSKMGLRQKASFCLCADNSFIVRWWPMTRLIPGMYKRFQIKADGHCYSHPIWLHHPLSGRYNPSLIWYKNLPVVKSNKVDNENLDEHWINHDMQNSGNLL